MRKMTEENIKAAFAGESQAHMKYLIFAETAEKEFPNLARLFRAISFSEQIHATNHFKLLGGSAAITDSLASAIEGETLEVEEMYPAFQAVADSQAEKSALRSMEWAFEAEKTHAKLYAGAKVSAEAGTDHNIGAVYVCSACGYTAEGQSPDSCPLCKAPKNKFRSF